MKNNRISIIFHTLLISADILMPEKPRTEPVQFCDKHNFVTPAAQNVMRKSLIYGFSHFSFSERLCREATTIEASDTVLSAHTLPLQFRFLCILL